MEQKSNRYSYIDGLRGIAALWVLFYHLWCRFFPEMSSQGHSHPNGPPADPWDFTTFFAFGFGYSGVTLFFVLSGFCIHLPQARSGYYGISMGSFGARRFWRLYPAYLASIAFAVFALALPKLLLATSGRSFDWWAEVHAWDAFVNAVFLQQLWPETLAFNGVYWTLVYEVQFYIAYPALLWLIRTFGLVPVGAALLACEVYFAYAPPSIPYFLLGKYFEWYLGVLAAELIARRLNRVPTGLAGLCTVVALGMGVASVFTPAIYPLHNLFFATGFFGLVLYVASGRSSLVAAFNWRALVGLGLISYSLYLIHVPVIDIVWVGLDRLFAPRLANPAVARWLSLAAIPLSIAGAYLFYRLFERPFLHVKTKRTAELLPARAEKVTT